MQLSEQVAAASAQNLQLASRLRIAECECQSYKKILADLQKKLADLRHQQLLSKHNTTSYNANNNSDRTSTSNNTTNFSSMSSTALPKPEQQQDEVLNDDENNASGMEEVSGELLDDEEDEEDEEDLLEENMTADESEVTAMLSSGGRGGLGCASLNTSDIAHKVRDLLSVHNIGQRLFAKSVLGLSQGTVSELLSKPKPWDKLTEKGRESYRKMHVWAANAFAVHALKASSPRKTIIPTSSTTATAINATNSATPTPALSNSVTQQDRTGGGELQPQFAATLASLVAANAVSMPANTSPEQRIAQLLLEAQKEMQQQRNVNFFFSTSASF